MFYHQSSNLIIPHRFHARFASQIASFWGNEDFLLPLLSKEKWLSGIADHDRWYDEFDVVDIIALRDNERERLTQRKKYREQSIQKMNGEAVIDSIVLSHVKEMSKKLFSVDKEINEIIAKQNNNDIDYDMLQSLTLFFDSIAFDCSLWKDSDDTLTVPTYIWDWQKRTVTYIITWKTITIDPRPFYIPHFEILLYWCKREKYPINIDIDWILYSFKQEPSV